ncbi:reverse transcriptase domain-containing protein [Tanacetum coccineum]
MSLLHHHLYFHLHLLLRHPGFVDDQLFLSDLVRLFLRSTLSHRPQWVTLVVDCEILLRTHLLLVHLQSLHYIFLKVHLQIHYQIHHQFIHQAFMCWRSAPLSTLYPPTTSESSLDSSFERLLDSSSPSARPSHKRCRSLATLVPSSTPVSRSIAPALADLPPRKRFKDSYSTEVSGEEHMETGTADAETVVDLGISEGVRAHTEDGIDLGVEVTTSDIREDEEEFEAEASEGGTMEIDVDPLATGDISEPTRGDAPNLEGALYDMSHYMSEVPLDRITEFETDQRYDGDNENGENKNDGNGNGGNRNGGNGNPNENDRGANPVARECTYQDFIKHQPLNFKGTEGVIRTIGADAAFAMSWREIMKLIAKVYCLRTEIQKMESELWNLIVKNNDLAAYTQRFQELTMLCTKMVLEEEDRVEKFIGGLSNNIQGNVIAVEPTRLQDAVRIANNLMDQKLKGYAVKNAKNKRKFDNSQKDNYEQQPPFKRQNVGGQNVLRAYMAGNNKRRVYNGPLPLCNKFKFHHEGPCTMRCGKYNKVGHLTRDCHYRNDFLKLKDQNRGNITGNKTRISEARGKAYVLGGGDANPDSNVVIGMFLLNNHYADVLFDSGADQSFVSTTFSILLDIIPDTLDVSYAVELADMRISETNTVLANHHAVIVCDEKIVRIPYGDEVLIVQVMRKETEDKSKEKRLEDVPTARDFSKAFPKDLPGLPPT